MPKDLVPTAKAPYWEHPTKSEVVCFYHCGEVREIDFKKLKSICRVKAVQMGKPEYADDFASAAVEISLRKIKNGFTEHGHLNNRHWLWSEFYNSETGSKSPNSKKALAHKNTVSYSKEINNDGDTYLDFYADNLNLNPEERLLAAENLKEKLLLLKAENDERKKVVPIKNYRPSIVAEENRVYVFLLLKSEYRAFGELNLNTLAEECGMGLKEFKLAIGRLDRKAKIFIRNHFYFLPDEFYFTDEAA